jgi:hypothetical protein
MLTEKEREQFSKALDTFIGNKPGQLRGKDAKQLLQELGYSNVSTWKNKMAELPQTKDEVDKILQKFEDQNNMQTEVDFEPLTAVTTAVSTVTHPVVGDATDSDEQVSKKMKTTHPVVTESEEEQKAYSPQKSTNESDIKKANPLQYQTVHSLLNNFLTKHSRCCGRDTEYSLVWKWKNFAMFLVDEGIREEDVLQTIDDLVECETFIQDMTEMFEDE